MQKTETKSLVVESFNTDFERRLNFETLGRDLLNTAEQHADRRGFGVNDIRPQNHAWVLSRLVIEMKEMPMMFTEMEITTWVESIYRLFTNRNFAIRTKDGEDIGYARSVWAMIDRTTRQPIELEQLYGDRFAPYLSPEIPCPIAPQTRLRPMKVQGVQEVQEVQEYRPVVSDIDYNGHVNSIKYIQHMCDMFSLEYYREHHLRRIEVAYINESKFGDTLQMYKQEIEPQKYQIEVRKNNSETVIRGMVCFE